MKRLIACLALVVVVGCSGGKGKTPPPPTTNDPTPVTVPTTGSCTTDADCRIMADYCTACDCRALGKDEPDPVCDGPGVKCIADPCMGKTAVCEAGACTAKATAP